jgi:hypothetical protein
MTNNVAFLAQLGEDLAEVARRDAQVQEGPGQVKRRRMVHGVPAGNTDRSQRVRRGRPPRWLLTGAAAAMILALCGGIGYVAMDGLGGAAADRGAGAGIAVPGPLRLNPRISAPDAGASHGPGSGGYGAERPPVGAPSPVPAGPSGVGQVPGVEPLIVKTADLSIVVPRGHFASAFARAAAVAAPLGGFVSSSSDTGLEARTGSLTIRVPSERFDDARAALRPLGRIEYQTIRGQDVTSQFVDLNARLRTWQAQEAALIRLMAKTTTVAETLRVQAQLQRVQLTIEQLRGQIRLIGDRTANATITVRLREQAKKVPPVVTKVTNPSFITGFKRAVAGLQGVLVAILVGIGYLLPLAALALIAWLIVRNIRRRRLATA